MRRWHLLVSIAAALAVIAGAASAQHAQRSLRLEEHAWADVETALQPETVVLLPVAPAAKPHGRHLPLRTDLTLAEAIAARIAEVAPVTIPPAVTYDHDPAFSEYPGSASLAAGTARDVIVDVARSLARHGPRRFYALHTGHSTDQPFQLAARLLAADGILLRHMDVRTALGPAARANQQQPGGSHADEIETSLMLHLAPTSVDMSRAVREYYDGAPGVPVRFTRQRGAEGVYSPSGAWGDPTLASAARGATLADALVRKVVADIEALRKAALPSPEPSQSNAPAARGARSTAFGAPGDCTPGDLRTIRGKGPAYTLHWSNGDAEMLAGLWAPLGDVIHPDGTIERTREIIMVNRRELFARREYRGSKHPLDLTLVRCLGADVAIADGKWVMTGVKDKAGSDLPPYEGQATLVFRRDGGTWLIEAYRYTVKPATTPPPVWLKRPGWPGNNGGSP